MLGSYVSQVRRWVNRGTEWVERMWLREERTGTRQGAGERCWTWVWLGRDATDAEISDVVRQVNEEVGRLPVPLGISEFMVTVTAWAARRDGAGEAAYLEARQAGDEASLQADLAARPAPHVLPIGDRARGHIIDSRSWSNGGAREQLRRTLQVYRPSRQWRVVQVSLFSVGEAYLRMVTRPEGNRGNRGS
ncbi:MAG: hypothetical protein ACUVX9_04675 [Anaerolineae bacterium]